MQQPGCVDSHYSGVCLPDKTDEARSESRVAQGKGMRDRGSMWLGGWGKTCRECKGPQHSTLTRLAKPLQQAMDAAIAHADAERERRGTTSA